VTTFDINRLKKKTEPTGQYERQLHRLRSEHKEVVCVEKAVRGAVENLHHKRCTSFVIYGEPQSGKTEMMICLTAKLLDEGHLVILHLLNDSVDLLGQNLGRFKSSGLAPAARNFSEVLDPAVKIKGQRHVIFCKKNGSDLRKLLDKLDGLDGVVVIDDEADYASPNSKVNSGECTPINVSIAQLLGDEGIYIGVTATPARLDLNNTFDNDSSLWVDLPPHNKYTGQDVFFPLEGGIQYLRTLLPDAGSDPKYARQALFSFLVNVAYLNNYVNNSEKNYSFLVHTSGKKVDHRSGWTVIHDALGSLIDRNGNEFTKYVQLIWELSGKRYADAKSDNITKYILDNISRFAIISLNSERDWKDNSSAATDPTSLFTIIIGGNIVSRGVTLNNLLSMFFTRDVKHKIQQDTYIQRARMFGSRGDYLRFFELTIPSALYVDWHRCFVFHRLALAAIKDGLGSLVWLGDQRIAPVASSSVDRSTVDLDRGEMSFGLFDYSSHIEAICLGDASSVDKLDLLAKELGGTVFPGYLRRYIQTTAIGGSSSIFVHPPADISGYAAADGLDKERVSRRKGFYGKSQADQAPASAVHRLIIFHNGDKKARLCYKFMGSIQFIKNTTHDS
jgi:Z1 domain